MSNINTEVEDEKANEEDETISLDDVLERQMDVTQYNHGLESGNNSWKSLYSFEYKLNQETELSIKKEVLKKAISMIKHAKVLQYTDQYNQINNQKIGFAGKLFGKEKLKQERLRNISLRITSENLREIPSKEDTNNYSIRNTLASLYQAAFVEIGANYTPEIIEFYNNIKSVYGQSGNQFTDEEIAKIAMQKYNNSNIELPNVVGNNGSVKNQIKWLQEDSKRLESENTFKKQNQGQNLRESIKSKNTPMNLIINELDIIDNSVKDNKYYDKVLANERQSQSSKEERQ